MGTHNKITPRRRPCSTCPYRRDVPSGIWDAHEYDKLPSYDGSTTEQVMAGAFALFFCHTADGSLCAGWVGCHDMAENLAIRMVAENIDYDAVLQYQSPVPLFGSGAEAAEHGKREISNPSPAACAKIQRLLKQRGSNGNPQ